MRYRPMQARFALLWLLIFCLLLAISTPIRAGLLAASTRVIYRQGDREQSLMLANVNDYPVVVQTWVDHGEADPNVLSPFASLPAVFQLLPTAVQGIRIVLADAETLPQDRESVFWLNLYEIPPTRNVASKVQRDGLALTMNTQLKIFYRPADLPKVEVAAQLRFTLVQVDGTWYVECQNATPYHASFTALEVVDGDHVMSVQSEMDMMTGPFSQRRYVLGAHPPAGQVLRYRLVDDAGFPQPFEAVLKH